MEAVAVVLASGSGLRYRAESIPKHLTPILNVPILVWTLNSAIESEVFSSIIVVVSKNDLLQTKKIIKEYFSDDPIKILLTEGSNERTKSFLFGFHSLVKSDLVNSETIVALLDANRPFIPINQFQDLFKVALEFNCSCPTRSVVNGIAKIDSNRILEVPDKQSYVEFVTPEFLKLDLAKISSTNFLEGYSCFVEYALDMGINPGTVAASPLNMKLTYPEDQTYLEGLALENQLLRPKKLTLEGSN